MEDDKIQGYEVYGFISEVLEGNGDILEMTGYSKDPLLFYENTIDDLIKTINLDSIKEAKYINEEQLNILLVCGRQVKLQVL